MATFNHANPSKSLALVDYPFWFGGSASSMAVFITHPLELIKVRMQVGNQNGLSRGPIQIAAHIVKSGGASGLYHGLSAGFTRTFMYGTTRFGLYEIFKAHYQSTTQGPPALPALILAAAVSGFVGGIVGNPADLANIRMQCDAGLSISSRRGYRNVFDAWIRMGREEGWRCFTRAWWPNSVRAALMTASQLASYDGFKTMLIQHMSLKDNVYTQLLASTLASLVATTLCSPVDVIKTRIMSTSNTVSILRLVTEVSRREGLTWMLRGWVPSFIRLGPQTVATFIFLEQHKMVFRALHGISQR